MANFVITEQLEENVASIATQLDTNLGNHRLRARQNKVDYCELKDKPGQFYRFVPASALLKHRSLKPARDAKQSRKDAGTSGHSKESISYLEPVVEEHVPVQLPEQVEPWSVWIKHLDMGLIAYGIWVNALEMMKDPDVTGRFLLCTDHRYTPVQSATPVTAAKLSDRVFIRPGNYQTIRLGKAFDLLSGRSFEEGEAILKVLQYAWPPGARPAKAYVGSSYGSCGCRRCSLGPHPKVHTATLLRLKPAPKCKPKLEIKLKPKPKPKSKPKSQPKPKPKPEPFPAFSNKQELRLGQFSKVPLLPESGEPVRVHVTSQRTHTVYGLWTNAQAAIEACQPGPLVFVQCEQDTYQPINPEVKYQNDKFYMLAGNQSNGGWRKIVKLDQQLSVPDGPTFESGTSIAQVFLTLLNLKAERAGVAAAKSATDTTSESVNRGTDAVGEEVEQNPHNNGVAAINAGQQGTASWAVVFIDNSPHKNQHNSSSNNNSKKRPATLSVPKSIVHSRKRAKANQVKTASQMPAKPDKCDASSPATLQQGCSVPAAATVPLNQSARGTMVKVKEEETDVTVAGALPDQDPQQQQVLVSLPPLSVDSQFDMDADSAKHILTALNRLLRSLNYGEQQAKQLWKGYKKAFLSDGISRASTSRKQEWATSYLQLADAVSSGDCQYVDNVLGNLFGVVP